MDKFERAVLETVNGILVKNCKGELAPADLAARSIDDLGFDSMDKLELVMELEDRLDVLFDNGGLLKCRTLDELIQFIGKVQ